jgi:hypothetical protein
MYVRDACAAHSAAHPAGRPGVRCCPLVVRFLLHFIPDGMQLIARFRTSSIHFRKPQVRQLTLLETS